MKDLTFEEYLQEVHAKEYIGTDDDMPDAFNDWLIELGSDSFLQYAEEWKNRDKCNECFASTTFTKFNRCTECSAYNKVTI